MFSYAIRMNIQISDVVEAARAGGDVVRGYFGKVLEAEQKSIAGDLRTKADVESEQAIIATLQKRYPLVNIYAEESGYIDKGSDSTFVVDPLDGTNNFVLGLPNFAVSIGVLKGDETTLGVIYNPILDQVYFAEKGKGAFLNGTQIHVNGESDISRATVSYTCGYHTPREYSGNVKRQLRDMGVKRLLDNWAPAYDYCLLASGRIEVVISKEGDLEDYVAAKIIVSEAGGKITDFGGASTDGRSADFVATNGSAVHNQIVALLS